LKRICASGWAITKNHCVKHGQQNVKFLKIKVDFFYLTDLSKS